MSLDDRMNAYKKDFDTLKIPKINKEPKEWTCHLTILNDLK
jgi:hypothetical protein